MVGQGHFVVPVRGSWTGPIFGDFEGQNRKTLRNVVFRKLGQKNGLKQHIGNFPFQGGFLGHFRGKYTQLGILSLKYHFRRYFGGFCWPMLSFKNSSKQSLFYFFLFFGGVVFWWFSSRGSGIEGSKWFIFWHFWSRLGGGDRLLSLKKRPRGRFLEPFGRVKTLPRARPKTDTTCSFWSILIKSDFRSNFDHFWSKINNFWSRKGGKAGIGLILFEGLDRPRPAKK